MKILLKIIEFYDLKGVFLRLIGIEKNKNLGKNGKV